MSICLNIAPLKLHLIQKRVQFHFQGNHTVFEHFADNYTWQYVKQLSYLNAKAAAAPYRQQKELVTILNA